MVRIVYGLLLESHIYRAYSFFFLALHIMYVNGSKPDEEQTSGQTSFY